MNQVERRIVHCTPASCTTRSARSASGSPRPESSTSRCTPLLAASLANERTTATAPGTVPRGPGYRRPTPTPHPAARAPTSPRPPSRTVARRSESRPARVGRAPLYYPAAGLARAAKNQRGLRFLRVVRTHLLLLFLTLVSIVTAVVLDPIRQALPVAHTLCSGNVVASESDCRRSGAASAKKHSPICFFALLSGSGDYFLSHATAGARPMVVKARRTFWCALLSSVRYCCMSLLTSNPRWIAFVCRFPTKL